MNHSHERYQNDNPEMGTPEGGPEMDITTPGMQEVEIGEDERAPDIKIVNTAIEEIRRQEDEEAEREEEINGIIHRKDKPIIH